MSPVIQLKHRSPRTNLSHRLDNTYGAPGSDKVYGTLRSGIRNKHSRRRDPVAAINARLRRRNPYRVDRRELNAEKSDAPGVPGSHTATYPPSHPHQRGGFTWNNSGDKSPAKSAERCGRGAMRLRTLALENKYPESGKRTNPQ